MHYQLTHYERTSSHARAAKRFLKQHGSIMDAVVAYDRPEAVIDILREAMRPDVGVDTEFEDAVDGPAGQQVQRFVTLLASQAPGMDERVHGEVATQLMVIWQTLRYEAAGRQTYVPSRDLSWQLAHTELRGLTADDISLPFPSLYIDVPHELGFTVHNDQTGKHPLYGVYVTQIAGGWRVMMAGAPNEKSIDELDDALTHFHVPMPAGRKLDDIIDLVVRHVTGKDDAWRRRQGMSAAPLDEIVGEWMRVLRWVVNLVFYITHADVADLEHVEANERAAALWRRAHKAPERSKKRRKLFDQLRDEPRRPRIVVGRRVVVDDGIRSRSPQSKTAGLRVRTLVAGHYQRYHTRAGTVWKHKEPYWKGEDMPKTADKTVRELR